MEPTVAYVWSYVVHEQHRDDFRQAYGPGGEWAVLYRRSAAYRGTDLLEDPHDRARFLTIDHFVGSQGRARFLDLNGDAYRALDARWQHAKLAETFVGEFVTHLHR